MSSIIEIDKGLFTQAISNLVDNGVKYGNESQNIIINAKNINSNKIIIEIINTGEGIPEEFVNKVFDRFFRIESSRNRKNGGVGLGLSVVKAIVNWHGGEIRVASIPQKETKFSIILPKVQ